MFEIDYKNLDKGSKRPLIFVVIGIILIAVFLGLYIMGVIKKNNYDKSVKTNNINSNAFINDDGSVLYSPIYQYKVNDNTYECKTSVSSSKKPNKTGTVYYNSKDPNDCMTDYSYKNGNFLLIGAALGVIFTAIGIAMIHSHNKMIKKIKKLETSGKLIKGIPYKMEDTGTVIHNKSLQRIVVNLNMSDGTIHRFEGEPRYDYKNSDEDGLVDLLLDPNDLSNYYLDFEIKYSGDVQVETYKPPVEDETKILEEQIKETEEKAKAVIEDALNKVAAVDNVIDKITNPTITIELGKDKDSE